MLTLYHSNSLNDLKEMLIKLISLDPLTDPLETEQILVQSPGMARWLQLELAEAFGIAASIDFPLPATFLWNMFIQVLDDVPSRSAFAKESMTWKLMGLLPELMDAEEFAPLQRYTENDEDCVRRYQLAGKIADIYDQYLVYRPEWIAEWEAGNNLPDITEGQEWQPILWRALVERTQQLKQPHWHRANMHASFSERLHTRDFSKKLPKRLFVFGISALPPGYVEALQALGQQCNVHLMITNPCRYYWGDVHDARYLTKIKASRFRDGMSPDLPESFDQNANPLLASMGKLGRDYLYQLQDLASGDQPVNEIDSFEDIPTNSLLHYIQQDILDLRDRTGQATPIEEDDNSLTFHGCHSPLREVEVLHDHLLHLYNNDPTLTPRDVIVMVPDIDSYTPFLQAVFGSVSDERYIPFALSDRSASQEHPVLAAFAKLLTLDQSRASGPELIELLEVKALQARYRLDAAGLATLSQWVDEAGIRWGFNASHQSKFDVPSREENTWLFGLRRMLLGYAMPQAMGLYNEVLPTDLVQGMNAELAGCLADFVESCEWLLKELDEARTADGWTAFLNQLLERFFLPDEEDEQALQSIRKVLEDFRQHLSDARFNDVLPRAVMVDWLQEHLGNTRNSQRFLAGQVNICTLMPMRSIPFRVVCLLGMNDNAYPRSLPPMGFDLMARHPRRGDRSRREDDRYLFLEALLSAQEQLYISHVSRNIRDDNPKFPSVLVTELQNLIRESFALKHDITHQHTLQSFSAENFKADNNRRSFAKEWLPAAQGAGTVPDVFYEQPLEPQPLPENNDLELPLAQLLSFWNNPCQAFCQQRLKVFFNDEDESAETREPFALGGLTGWQLKDSLVHKYLEGGSESEFRYHTRAAGVLPHGNFGELAIDDLCKDAKNLAELVEPWLKNHNDDVEVNLFLNDSRLTGWLDGIHHHGQVFWRTGRLHDKHRFSAWIQHLCLCAAGQPAPGFYLTADAQFRLNPVDPDIALSYLSDMERLLRDGLTRPLPFFPETAWAWLKEAQNGVTISDNEEDLEKALKKATDAFYGTGFSSGENTDPYIQRCWPDLETMYPEMIALASTLLLPLATHLQDLEKGEQP